MVSGKYKEIAKGVAISAVGGVAFGFGMQYIFTSGMVPATEWIPGVTNNVVVALLLGTTGFALAAYKPRLLGDYTDILKYGGAAVIGMGLASQLGFTTGLRAPFRTPQTFAMPRTIMTAPMNRMPSDGLVGPKII